MLLRGIAAGLAATVSRALLSALPTVVHDNAIPNDSEQTPRREGIKSRTGFVIGVIFLAVTLAALSRSGAASGPTRSTNGTTSSRCMWSIACFEAVIIPTEQRN